MNSVQKFILNRSMQKIASTPIGEYFLPGLNPIAPISEPIGGLFGFFGEPLTREERKAISADNELKALIPGNSGYRRAARRKSIAAELGNNSGYAKPISEALGGVTSVLAGGGLGAGVGAGLGALINGKEGATAGALLGGGIGGGLAGTANIIGSIAALIKNRRDEKAQREYERSGAATTANYLVPGVAAYNGWKSLGYAQGDAERLKAEALLEAAKK